MLLFLYDYLEVTNQHPPIICAQVMLRAPLNFRKNFPNVSMICLLNVQPISCLHVNQHLCGGKLRNFWWCIKNLPVYICKIAFEKIKKREGNDLIFSNVPTLCRYDANIHQRNIFVC